MEGKSMARPRKMVALNIEETSGVDHPAHLQEGWLVIKSADSDVANLLSDLAENENDSGTRLIQDGTEEEPMAQDETIETPVAEEAVVVEETAEATPAAEEVEKDALADAKKKIAELEAKLAETMKELDKMNGKDEKYKKSETTLEDEVIKSAPESVQKMFADAKAAAVEAIAKAAATEEILKKEREERADADAIEKAKAWGHLPLEAAKIGPALRRLAAIDSDLAKSVEEMLNAVEAQAESANIFAEIGKSATPAGGSAYETLTSMAKAVVENGGGTFEAAFTDAILKNPSLYNQYLSEKGAN
jgi:hypothetical protein